MKAEEISPALMKELIKSQKNEVTEWKIYEKLSNCMKDEKNADILKDISQDELRHSEFWKEYTKKDIKPIKRKVFWYYWLSRILGVTFGLKLMERGEEAAQMNYDEIAEYIPEAKDIANDENRHENELLALFEEERLSYVGSMVLGLNDALVELTGALAGLSFALRETRLIALAGLITGVAASFSMAASEYLANKSEGEGENALKSALYTGGAYIITVFILIMPYLLFDNYIFCLALTLALAVIIIFVFNFYISVAKDYDFKKRFFEMAGISLGVAAFSFGIGYVIRIALGVEI